MDGAPPQPPPGADTDTVAAWITAYSNTPPTYWAPYAVAERLRAIAEMPDDSLLEADDAHYEATRYETALLVIRDFIHAIATATPPEPAS